MMNRLVPVVIVTALALGACVPGLSQASGGNSVATANAVALTAAGLTLAAQPTQTALPTSTEAPTATATQTAIPATKTATATKSATVSATAGTITVTATLITATGTLASPTNTVTGTPPSPTSTVTGTPPTATATEELAPRVYGTQPPYIQYGRVHLVNQANRDVYVSFQCTTPEGYFSIVEYPVYGRITVSVPAGRCDWVAWVGGRQFTGRIGLSRFEEFTMTFKKNSVTIK